MPDVYVGVQNIRYVALSMSKPIKSTISSWIPAPLLLRYRTWKARRCANEPELRLLSAFGGRGSFVDVGANIGAWSITGAKLFAQVHAFEPDRSLSTLLRSTMPANVLVHPVALSDHSGMARLAVPFVNGNEVTSRASLESGANPGFSEVYREVELTTLDSYQLRDIAVIKIDVEGHEGSVLDGAAATIARERPTLIIEIEERHHRGHSHEVFDRLLRQGYVCQFVRGNRLSSFDITMISQLQPVEMEPEIGIKYSGYINNFIFVPQERSQILLTMAKLLAR